MSTIEGEIKQACAARANLHVFAAVIGLLESGAIVGGCTAQVAANRIIAICKKEELSGFECGCLQQDPILTSEGNRS